MASMDAEIKPRRSFFPFNKEFCFICYDIIDSDDLMFSVDNCGHRYCINCVKQHIKVKLLDGKIPNCPHYRCKSQLPIDRCGKLLTSELSFMWEQRIREDLTPMEERVYCPYTSCSYLMSKTLLSTSSSNESGPKRRCFGCGHSFCLQCKVPWHSNISCTDYKKLHPSLVNVEDAKLKSLANLQGWRQCGKCQHMIELSYGCNHITCRCGYAFCYTCGKEWNMWSHGKCSTYRLGDQTLAGSIVVSLTGLVVCLIVWVVYWHKTRLQ